jgi:hypothetical protein
LGYIIVALAASVGAGALLLPVPEQIDVPTEESVSAPQATRSPASGAAAAPRSDRKGAAASSPGAAPAKPDAPAQPAVRPPFPMQDTTKTRTMVQPKS